MGSMFRQLLKTTKLGVLSLALCMTSGCSSMADDKVQGFFLWGPVTQDLGNAPAAEPAFTGESKAAQLREELLAPVNRYAPSDKDWRFVRGTDKGPTIFGARMSFSLSDGSSQLRLGAVRRGSNRTYGPQVVFNFNDEKNK